MKDFATFLTAEQAPISDALSRVITTLPQSVQEIARYALLSGGKRLRPILTLICASLFNPRMTEENPRVYDASIVLEMFHVASLLHDDILDNASSRRGQVSTHIKFGIRPCILAGDALLAAGNRLMAEFDSPNLMNSISNALLNTATGEIKEIEWTGKILPTMDDYFKVIEGKTAYILRSACEVGGLFAKEIVGEKVDEKDLQALISYGHNLGMAFQMVDDALDFAPEAVTGKPQGGDLREAKCTPPILMYVESLPLEEQNTFKVKFAQLAEVLNTENQEKSPFTQEEFEKITNAIIEAKFPERTKDLANDYLQKAEEAISSFTGAYKDMLVTALTFVRERKK